MGRRSWAALGAVVVLGVLTGACSSSDSVDEAALPKPDAPTIGLAVNASVALPKADLPTFDDGNGHGAPAAGGYQIGVKQASSLVTAPLPQHFFADQDITAHFDTTGSPADAGFGVVCRMQDTDNYYRLGVGNDGTYAIARVKGGDSTVLTGDGKWVTSPVLRPTAGPFDLRALCVGDTLVLFAGNQQVATVKDATFTDGDAGVFVETFHEPNAIVEVQSLAVRSFRDRSRLCGAATDGWDDLLRTSGAATPCTLLDPKRARVSPSALFVTKCGDVLSLQADPTTQGAKVFDRMLAKAGGPSLTTVKGLPNCAKRTGIRGPLPPPTPDGYTDNRTSIGKVACLDLGKETAVVWLHELGGTVGVVRIKDGDRAGWKNYGPDWPPFHYVEKPA